MTKKPKKRSDRSTTPSSAEQSRRSKSGCATCRERKVKCNEVHPICGDCARLQRPCSWTPRTKWRDETEKLQKKHSDFDTAGNPPWDPDAKPLAPDSPPIRDRLGDFATLQNDEDRREKARHKPPGTYSVIVTPESFAGVYASSAESADGDSSDEGSQCRAGSRAPPCDDPNTVVLEQFEDSTKEQRGPDREASSRPSGFDARAHNGLLDLAPIYMATPSLSDSPTPPVIEYGTYTHSDGDLLRYFRDHVMPRLDTVLAEPMKTELQSRVVHFPPLYDAICAVSALHQCSRGGSREFAEALNYYHRANNAVKRYDAQLDPVFMTHYLLLIWQTCHNACFLSEDRDEAWTRQANTLLDVVLKRHASPAVERYGPTLWDFCELDIYAGLLGYGNCDVTSTLASYGVLPRFGQEVPPNKSMMHGDGTGPFDRTASLPDFAVRLKYEVILHAAKVAQLAHDLRVETSSHAGSHYSQRMYKAWLEKAKAREVDFTKVWSRHCPEALRREHFPNPTFLPEEGRGIFMEALLLYHTCVLYLRTSLLPHQRAIYVTDCYEELSYDTEPRVHAVLQCALAQIERGLYDCRHTVFAVFMAGVTSMNAGAKYQAAQIMRAFERYGGLSNNTERTLLLFDRIQRERQDLLLRGTALTEVGWVATARESDSIINCGL